MSGERPMRPERPAKRERKVHDRPVVSDREVPLDSERPGNGAATKAEFAALRELLVGPEQKRLHELADRLEALGINPATIADHLPEAIALRSSRGDRQLGRALAPTVETALRESIRRNPREVAAAIFPVLGPAIRKAIAETMAGLVRSINSAVEHSLSIEGIKWRIESWRTGVPYAEIVVKHALVYRVEQVFLIHAETGLLLAHVTAPDLKVPDADLISSMLTAIQDFVRDSFQPNEGATLRTFTVGEHTVQVEAGPRALLAAVIRGQAPESVTQRIAHTLETIHLEFATPLAEFSGDAAPFTLAQPLLAECLETVTSRRRGIEHGKQVWLRWAIPVAVVGLAALGLTIRSRVRWAHAVRTLEAEPGIVVVKASRGWGGWKFAGLRDPMAREPKLVLASAGYLPNVVSERWETYLSLDSSMVVERAKRVLSVPRSATLALQAGILAIVGPAPVDWLGTVRAMSPPPGVERIDLASVEPTLSPGLDSVRRAIEAQRVLFDVGSSELTSQSIARLRAVATSFARLAAPVSRAGASVQLNLFGRTDPTGTDAHNQSLSQWRIDAVAERLWSLGVAEALIDGQPLATTRPLKDADPVRQARINRSVSFEVTLSGTPRPSITRRGGGQ